MDGSRRRILCLRLFTHPPEEGARKGGTYIDSICQAFASSSPRGLAVDDIPHCLDGGREVGFLSARRQRRPKRGIYLQLDRIDRACVQIDGEVFQNRDPWVRESVCGCGFYGHVENNILLKHCRRNIYNGKSFSGFRDNTGQNCS